MYAGIGMTLQDAFARDYREARNKYGRNELEPEQSGWLASSSHCPLCAVTGRLGTAVQQAVGDSWWHSIGMLVAQPGTPLWKLILKQFDDLLVKILMAAAAVDFVIAMTEGDSILSGLVEPMVIMLILVANATVGVVTERNAETAIEELRAYEAEVASVLRGGQLCRLAAAELVPGDIVEVVVGGKVPADLRLAHIYSSVLKVDQSLLTGESQASSKQVDVVADPKAVYQDKTNMLFSGTLVVAGRARGIVVGTGASTAIGVIRDAMREGEDVVTPLKAKLDEFGTLLSKVIAVICVLVWLININHFKDPALGGWLSGAIHYLKIAVALAVAAIPEGLPAVVTTCLALGTRKMAARQAIVRTLPSVETLGCTTAAVICSDKTGTLTTNQMSVVKVAVVAGSTAQLTEYDITGTTFNSQGCVLGPAGVILRQPSDSPCLLHTAMAAALCNDAHVAWSKEKGALQRTLGSPQRWPSGVAGGKDWPAHLPGACPPPPQYSSSGLLQTPSSSGLATFAQQQPTGRQAGLAGLAWLELNGRQAGRAGGRHAGRHRGAGEQCRGLPCPACLQSHFQRVTCLEFSRDQQDDERGGAGRGGAPRCGASESAPAEVFPGPEPGALQEFGSQQALRCLALAVKTLPGHTSAVSAADESELTFIGLVGMHDPPRAECRAALETCRAAGIRVIMVTGDNKGTAEAVAHQIGALSNEERQQLRDAHNHPGCTPNRPYLAQGHVVAMTGDGVNDAPALMKADIGVAMGSGTAVAKSASDMVLADDNFATIVFAVAEGRAIYANTKQFIRYMISSNIGEVVAIFLAALLGMPEVLTPVQLLWVNLVTDGLPATALGFNRPDKDLMLQRPRRSAWPQGAPHQIDEPIVNGWLFVRYVVIGAYVGLVTVAGFVWWYLHYGLGCEVFSNRHPTTISMSVLVVVEMFNALNNLSEDASLLQLLQIPPWDNRWLLAAISTSMLLHVFILYCPPAAAVFGVTGLSAAEWGAVLCLSAPVIAVDEVMKAISRRRRGFGGSSLGSRTGSSGHLLGFSSIHVHDSSAGSHGSLLAAASGKQH
ncbi:hypothetical protein QJQ45_027070 [Haematococcus lacustris]|nr:hypothetical protein QJQ45_027070 [Haematococcus lacustris]